MKLSHLILGAIASSALVCNQTQSHNLTLTARPTEVLNRTSDTNQTWDIGQRCDEAFGHSPLTRRNYMQYGYPREWRKKPWDPPMEGPLEWWDLNWQTCKRHRPFGHLEGCLNLRSLEWLAYTLINPAEEIMVDDATNAFRIRGKGGGKIAMVLRAILVWIEMNQELTSQLQSATTLNTETQLRLAQCYLDYVYQVFGFLQAIEPRASSFHNEDAAKCIVYDKLEILYLTYSNVAKLMHGEGSSIKAVLDVKFPDVLPNYWSSKYGDPEPGEIVGEYVRKRDWPILGGSDSAFERTQAAWMCVDRRPSWPSEPWRQQDTYLIELKEWQKSRDSYRKDHLREKPVDTDEYDG